jgi:nucleotide-binding universal stress UspA family protein
MERMLIGSVAEQVVREAPCPVLTVRASHDMQVRRILVPVDFSDRAKAAIPVAQDLAEQYGADVELFFVIDEDELPVPGATSRVSRWHPASSASLLPAAREAGVRRGAP